MSSAKAAIPPRGRADRYASSVDMLCNVRRQSTKHIASLQTMQAAYDQKMPKVDAPRPYRLYRRLRLATLRDELGGPKDLARALYNKDDANDTHLIACLKGRRDVGDDLASDLEVATGKPPGWMDSNPALDGVQPELSERAIFVAEQLDAIKDPEARDRAAVLCEVLAALAQAGQLQSAISALRALSPAALAGEPSQPPRPGRGRQTSGGPIGQA